MSRRLLREVDREKQRDHGDTGSPRGCPPHADLLERPPCSSNNTSRSPAGSRKPAGSRSASQEAPAALRAADGALAAAKLSTRDSTSATSPHGQLSVHGARDAGTRAWQVPKAGPARAQGQGRRSHGTDPDNGSVRGRRQRDGGPGTARQEGRRSAGPREASRPRLPRASCRRGGL